MTQTSVPALLSHPSGSAPDAWELPRAQVLGLDLGAGWRDHTSEADPTSLRCCWVFERLTLKKILGLIHSQPLGPRAAEPSVLLFLSCCSQAQETKKIPEKSRAHRGRAGAGGAATELLMGQTLTFK